MENLAGRVAIVGAGYAGMATAVTLAERAVPVTVFESGPVPGGRARRVSSQDKELDNGQHILIGAYSALFRIMRTVGVPARAVLRLPLEIHYPGKFHLRSLRLPSPLGLLAGLLSARGVSLAERLGAARFISVLKKKRFLLEEDISVEQLLARHGVPVLEYSCLFRKLFSATAMHPGLLVASAHPAATPPRVSAQM